MREELGDFRAKCKLCSFQLGLITVEEAKLLLLSSKVIDICCVLSEGCFSGTCFMLGLSEERTWHRKSGCWQGSEGWWWLPGLTQVGRPCPRVVFSCPLILRTSSACSGVCPGALIRLPGGFLRTEKPFGIYFFHVTFCEMV